MFTTLETLTPPGIKDREFGEYIFGPFTIMSTAWGSYYINGNLNSNSRENLRFRSNFGNLQTAVYKGSIRAVYDITETAVENPIDAVLEQNDYYAFGCRIETPDLPKMAANRYGYNGKETLQRSEHITLDHS